MDQFTWILLIFFLMNTLNSFLDLELNKKENSYENKNKE